VVLLDYGRFANFDKTVFKSLLLAGRILNREKRARLVIDFIQENIEDLKLRNQGAPKPKVYVGGLGFKGAHGLMSTDSDYTPFTWNQANNVALPRGEKTHLFMDFEELIKKDPDFIFVDAGGLVLLAGDYAKKPDFYNLLKAFKNKQVYVLHPFNWYTTNICTALVDAYQVGKIINPSGFRDVNPVQKANEIYSFMVGKPVHAQMAAEYGPLGAGPGFLK
jgi:iron complex transport system substrate-binding protein